MAIPNVKTQSGNRVQVELDGKVLGLIQNVSGDDDYANEPASGIGDIHPQEHVPTAARHTVTVSKMVLRQDVMRSAGIFLRNGDDALKGLVFDIVVYDKDTNRMLRKYIGCSFNSGRTDINKHAIIMASGTFNALDVQGEGV